MGNTYVSFTADKARKMGENTYDNLEIIENELVPVYETSTGEKVVYGTDLHAVLEVKTAYKDWSERRLKECDAIENVDYEAAQICAPSGQTMKQHIIKLDTAKEMAMLERNEKGKQVRRYFIKVEKKYKEGQTKQTILNPPPFMLCLQGAKFVADDLKVAESSRLLMYNGVFKEFGLPAGFIPKYEDNGSRERCSATELLKRNCCGISASRFNEALIKDGFLEIKERRSSKGNGIKTYKSLTDKGLQYGVNLVNEKNQKEVQPYYYADTFMELFERVRT